MDWSIDSLSCDSDYPIGIVLTLDTEEELADFYARMNIIASDGIEVDEALKLAQDFEQLPEPNDELLEDFYQDLHAFIDDMLDEDEEGEEDAI